MNSTPQQASNFPNQQHIESGSRKQVSDYLTLLRKWNSACSLVSNGDLEHLNERHVADSMALLPLLEQSRSHLDIGSGGGFPGAIIAIASRKMRVVLNDRSLKKCRFLRHVKMELDLANVEVLELDIKRNSEFNERFDTVTMRAVGTVHRVWDLGSQFLNESGTILMQTSHKIDESKLIGATVRSTHQTRRGFISLVSKSFVR
ncbi:MAG: 16S rRNA (guanine(527)-N(7))-methyltransferase RsmG [Gammaproteobacteria bacterium]|nr:16S rRNA (guanine(527)-N(7))-methyltransferase RsmG [Gammaproteobacteria bacterium]